MVELTDGFLVQQKRDYFIKAIIIMNQQWDQWEVSPNAIVDNTLLINTRCGGTVVKHLNGMYPDDRNGWLILYG